MNAFLFGKFRRIAYDNAGIAIKDGKETLVNARIGKRLRALGLESPRQYLNYLEDDKSGEEIINFLDVISTNYTHFFREESHFDFLKQKIGEWLIEGQRTFRLWSAASSTGEEPYSMALAIDDAIKNYEAEYKILATDLSTSCLDFARMGVYKEKAVTPIPKVMRIKYFDKSDNGAGDDAYYSVKPRLQEKVFFKWLNLSLVPYPMKGPFDAIFCRNVMIYFDNRVRQNLLNEIERLLRPGGLLMTGHAETLTNLKTGLKLIRPSVYIKHEAHH